MMDSGTTARGLYKCRSCQALLGWRVPMEVRSGPVRSVPINVALLRHGSGRTLAA